MLLALECYPAVESVGAVRGTCGVIRELARQALKLGDLPPAARVALQAIEEHADHAHSTAAALDTLLRSARRRAEEGDRWTN